MIDDDYDPKKDLELQVLSHGPQIIERYKVVADSGVIIRAALWNAVQDLINNA